MSDNIHRGPWGDRADESGSSGSEPPSGPLAGRVTSLEVEVKAMRSSLHGLELASARIESALSNIATKADMASSIGSLNTLAERVKGTEDRAGRIEKSVDGALNAAIGKSIGWWQFPLILAGSAAVLTAAAVGLNWLSVHGYFPHSP